MSLRIKTWLTLIVIFAITAGAITLIHPNGPDFPKREIKTHLGLDLQGGAHLVYQAKLEGLPQADQADALASVRDVLEQRVNSFGVAEPRLQTNVSGRIIIELPGIEDTEKAIEQIGQTPLLEFKKEETGVQEQEDQDQPIISLPTGNYEPTGLNGAHLKKAEVTFDQYTGEPTILLSFNGEGKDLFATITKENIGRRIGIFLDGNQLSAPVVQSEIATGEAVISGSFSAEEAKLLKKRLNAGALPVPVELLSQQRVGATLGQDAYAKSLKAGLIGFVAIMIFMIIMYRLPGLLSALALASYGLILWACFQTIPVVLTLAGVAGFLLSVGFAVDANVLIFERVKEELKNKRSPESAVEEGFKRAWIAVRDSNVSTLITCVILYAFGTSIVKGFALTLGLGVVISMFSAITITRTLLRIVIGRWTKKALWVIGSLPKTTEEKAEKKEAAPEPKKEKAEVQKKISTPEKKKKQTRKKRKVKKQKNSSKKS